MTKDQLIEQAKELRRKEVRQWHAIAGLDNDAELPKELDELTERYINFEITGDQYEKEGKKLIKKLMGIK